MLPKYSGLWLPGTGRCPNSYDLGQPVGGVGRLQADMAWPARRWVKAASQQGFALADKGPVC